MAIDRDTLSKIESDVPLIDPLGQPTPAAEVLEHIQNLMTQNVDANYNGERVLQLLRLERADNFYRGIQNIAPSLDPNTGAISWTSYGASGLPIANSSESADYDRMFDYNPRLVASYGKKFVSVLGTRPFFNTNAEPLDPTSDTDRYGARQVNLLIQMLHTQWKVRKLNYRLAYYLYKTGTTFGHLRPFTSAKKYGYYTVSMPGEPEVVEVHPGGYDCPYCGGFTPAPEPSEDNGLDPFCSHCSNIIPRGAFTAPVTALVPGPQKDLTIAQTSVDLELLNGYTITHPFNVVELDESPWIVSEVERDFGRILQDHPNARDIVGPSAFGSWSSFGEPAGAYAAVVRGAAQSQTGTVRARNTMLRTYRNVWLHSQQIELIQDDKIRKAAKQTPWAAGIRITQVEGKTVRVKSSDFAEEFSSCLPDMSDYLFCDGASWGIFGLEDGMSNLLNIGAETYETGITKFLVNPEYVDADALNRNRYSPNRYMPSLPARGGSLNEAFATFPASDPPQGLGELSSMYKDLIEGFLGLLPQVYGNMPEAQTLGQARIMLTQGLVQLSTNAAMMIDFWEQTDTNAVRMFVKTVNNPVSYNGQTIDLDAIRNSNWAIRGDSTIPRSFAERKVALEEIVTQNPDMAKAMHITDPVNYPVTRQFLDLPIELKNPTADMVDSLEDIMGQLWTGTPTPTPQPDGSSKLNPSIPFDGLVFKPDVAISVAQSALVTSVGQRRQASPGYANIRAFLQQAQDALNEQNALQPQPPRLSLALDLSKAPTDQEAAVLQKFGIQVPTPGQQPSMTIVNKSAQLDQQHALKMEQGEVKHGQNIELKHVDAALKPPPSLDPMDMGSPPPGSPMTPVQ